MFKLAIFKTTWTGPLAALLLAFPLSCFGQAYPSKPLRIILSVEPGASTNDILTRALAERLARELGQPVLVDNRPGAHGNIGMVMGAKAPPDGYTLVAGYSGVLALNPSMYEDIAYDSERDFATIARFSTVPYVIVVNPSVPANNLKEFIALAKAQPGKLNYASSGVGGTPHLASELLKLSAGIDVVHIPYKAAASASADLISGKVELRITGLTGVLGSIKAGKIRALAVTTDTRSPLLPDVPTAIQAGLKDYDVSAWLGLLAPIKVPPTIIDRLARDTAKVANSAEMIETLRKEGAEPGYLPPAEFKSFIAADRIRWARVIKSAGIKGE